MPKSKIDRIVEENSDVWKNESAFLNFIRGGVRRGLWEKHPVKLKIMKERRKRIVNPNEDNIKRFPEVWGGQCEVCKQLFSQKDLQVDHIQDAPSRLREVEDIQKFVEAISFVVKEDLRLVCKPCHGIISYSQKQGVSFEEARVAKEVIAICKDDAEVLKKLEELGVKSTDIPKTKKAKKELLTKLMKQEAL